MGVDFVLELEPRPAGQGGISQARQSGRVPGIIYGATLGPTPIQIPSNALDAAISRGAQHRPFKVKLPNQQQTELVVIKALERDTFSQRPSHVDLMVLTQDKPVSVSVSIVLKGERELAARGLQSLLQVHEVTVHAQLTAIPNALEVPVQALKAGDSFRIADLKLPRGATVQEPPEQILLTVVRANRTYDEGETGTESSRPSGA